MTPPRPVFTVIGGPNGAGKSTMAAALVRNGFTIGQFINADDIAAGRTGLKETSDFAAGREAVRLTQECIAGGISFTRETTLTGSEILRVMERARQAGFKVNLIFIGLDSVETAKERVRARVEAGGHDIPEAVQERRFQKSLGHLAAAVKRADDAYFFDNRGASHELVGEAQNGRITRIDRVRAPWLESATKDVERAPSAEAPAPSQDISNDEARGRIQKAERLADGIEDPDRRAVALQHLDAMRRAAGLSPTQGRDEKDQGDFEADGGEDG